MKINLTKLAWFPLSAAGLVLLTISYTGENHERTNPCSESSAIYVDGKFVECFNSRKETRRGN